MAVARKRTEVFVCDHCGRRMRLETSKRHWCENCTSNSPIEMRPVRNKIAAPRPIESR